MAGTFFGRAMTAPARAAAALFTDLPFTGQVNLLTSSSFDYDGTAALGRQRRARGGVRLDRRGRRAAR